MSIFLEITFLPNFWLRSYFGEQTNNLQNSHAAEIEVEEDVVLIVSDEDI